MVNNDYEIQVANLVNAERSKAGVPALRFDSEISYIARFKSGEMMALQYFGHESPIYGSPSAMLKLFGVQPNTVAENIAKGPKTPQEVMNMWMNSYEHRNNILNPIFNAIGVGFVYDRQNTYWTQLFV